MHFLLFFVWAGPPAPALAATRNKVTMEISLPDLWQRAEILIDQWGVPHIYAKNDRDLFFVQG
jgi:penicillin amidase